MAHMKHDLPPCGNERPIADRSVFTITTDLHGTITSVCHDFITLSGYLQEELLGASHTLMRHPDMPTSTFDNMWHTLKSGKSWNGLVKNRCKNGDYYWVDTFITPIVVRGQTIGYQAIQTRPNSARVTRTERIYAQMRRGQIPFSAEPSPGTPQAGGSL